jgi:predicted O-methyltransferase YrrM
MLCSWQQGMLLQFISQMMQPLHIFEIGTFTGYSAICLSQGLLPHGILHTCDPDDETLEIAINFINRSDRAYQIATHNADARTIAPLLDIEFNLVFLDGDKREYLQYYEMILPLMRHGAFLIADNTLWSGKILEKSLPSDQHTRALQEFNEYINNDNRVENVILPLRDGISIVRKI